MNRRDEFFAARERYFKGQHQLYFLDLLGAPSSATADIIEWDCDEGIGQATRCRIRFAHDSHDLSQREYIGKMGSLLIQPPRIERYGFFRQEQGRHIYGVVRSFAKLSSSKDQSVFEITLESRLSLLNNAPKTRYFYDVSEPEVIQQLLKEHDFNQIWANVEMQLYRTYRKRDIITQADQSDLEFIKYLCERTGIWFVCREGKECEEIAFGDDLTHYQRDGSGDNRRPFALPFLPESGTNAHGAESIRSLEMHAGTVPAKFSVSSYNYRQAPHLVEANAQIHTDGDNTAYGEAYVFGLPILTKDDAQREAALRQEAALSGQIEYRGEGDGLDILSGAVIKFTNHELADAKHGLLIKSTRRSATRSRGFKVEFTAMPSDRLFRMPMHEAEWPRFNGVRTAVIASTKDFSGPYIDENGEYILQFHGDRDERVPGQNSCALRLAKVFAGANRSGTHIPYLPGTEVAVAYFMGRPDLPYILHALHNAQHPDPVHHEHQWRTRNVVLHSIRNNTIQAEDRSGQEHIKIATEPGKSQLNLGHAVNRSDEIRGIGFELRSDERGVVRGGHGLLLTSETQSTAQGSIDDMNGATRVFEALQGEAQSLGEAAAVSKAEFADLKRENAWLKDELADLKQSVIALSAPNGIGMATPDRVIVAAGKDISATTSRSFNVSALKNVAIAAKDVLSLFAYKAGVKLFAQQGPVEIQAQSDALALAAQKTIKVTGADDSVYVAAKEEILVECGGAFIEIKDGNMTLGGPGKLTFKFASMKKDKAQVAHVGGPSFSTVAIPFKTTCDAWLSGSNVPEKFAPPELRFASWEQYANSGTAIPAAPMPPQSASPTHPNADLDPAAEPKLPKSANPNEPLQLLTPVVCDWASTKLEKECIDSTETPSYMAVTDKKKPWTDQLGNQIRSGGNFPTKFHLSYDPQAKTLVANVRIRIIPVDLVRVDSSGKPILIDESDPSAFQSVPYEHTAHWQGVARGVNKPFDGVMLKYRDGVGMELSLPKLKQNIERTLNGHNSLLILDGCSKGASCGCRVNIRFTVDFLLSIKDADVGVFHKEIRLFPRGKRVDAGSWAEINYSPTWKYPNRYETLLANNIAAHECGHLFNYPDEYWQFGGFVHSAYVSNNALDFAAGSANSNRKVWQIESQTSLMGGGCNLATATLSPYYLEYIRKHFSGMTSNNWRIGFL